MFLLKYQRNNTQRNATHTRQNVTYNEQMNLISCLKKQ